MEKMKFEIGNMVNKNSRPLKNLKYKNPNAEYAGDKFEREGMIEMNNLSSYDAGRAGIFPGGTGVGNPEFAYNPGEVAQEIQNQTGQNVDQSLSDEIDSQLENVDTGSAEEFFIKQGLKWAADIFRNNSVSPEEYQEKFFNGLERDAPGAYKILKGEITDPVTIQNVIDNLEGKNGGWLALKDENRWIRNREGAIKKLIEDLKKIKKTGDIIVEAGADARLTKAQQDTQLAKLADKIVKRGRATKTEMEVADTLANSLKNRSNKWAYTKDFIRLYFYTDAERARSRAAYEQRKNDPNWDNKYQDYSRRMIKLIDIITGFKTKGREGTPTETGGVIPPSVPPTGTSEAGMNKVVTYGLVVLLLGYLANMYLKKAK